MSYNNTSNVLSGQASGYDPLAIVLSDLRRDIDDLKRSVYSSVQVQVPGNFTAGSALFGGSDGSVSQDNANFFWDDANNRLGIGTASPQTQLHIMGPFTSNSVEQLRLSSKSGRGSSFMSYGTGAASTGDALYIAANAQYDGAAWNRIDTAGKAWLLDMGDQAGDVFGVFRVASGGNPISWTTLLSLSNAGTITAIGGLNLGTGSGAGVGQANLKGYDTNYNAFNIESAFTGGTYSSIKNTSTSGRDYWMGSTGSASGFGVGKYIIYDNTASLGRLVIDSSGQIGIGGQLSPSNTALQILRDDGNYHLKLERGAATARVWGIAVINPGTFILDDVTGAARRLSIDTSGNFILSGPSAQLTASSATHLVMTTTSGSNKRTETWYTQSGTTQFQVGVDFANNNTRDFYIYDTVSAALRFYIGSTGSIGVFGANPGATRQTVTGSRGGNAALASFLTAMANFGWITDSTTV